MDAARSLFDRSVHCASCPVVATCGASTTEWACANTRAGHLPGGLEALHPRSPDFDGWFNVVNTFEFDDVVAQPASLPGLGAYLPQVRNNAGLAGALRESVYVVKLGAVLRRGKIVPATAVRARLGLVAGQRLVLLLFDRDRLLERVWDDQFIWMLAAAGYDAVVAPSYSLWVPRPRPEHLLNMKRSLIVFAALQQVGVPAVVRLAWHVERDVERWAAWTNGNRCVDLVALDLQTYRSAADWRRQLAGLAMFDSRTGRRLRYLINGPTVLSRYVDLYRLVEPERIHLTNATTQLFLRGALSVLPLRGAGRRLSVQTRRTRALLAAARDEAVPTTVSRAA